MGKASWTRHNKIASLFKQAARHHLKSGELFALTGTAWVDYRLAAENRTSQLPWRLAQYSRQVCAVQTTAVDHPRSPCMVRG